MAGMVVRTIRHAHAPRLVAALVLALVLLPARSRADWPLPRGNVQRTGVATGVSDLQAPVPYWRHYLGGTIGSRGAIFMDVDSDTSGEVILVSGGKLVAKERGDALVWQTPVLGISEIVATADLDGNSAIEVVVRGTRQVFVIEPGTGQVLWEEPAEDFGYLGGVRVGDLDGDGMDDLLVQECGCCRINNGNTGFMYSFAAGFDAPPEQQKKWTMGSVRCGGFKSMAILDIDGDGRAEVTEGWPGGMGVLDGATGTAVAPVLELGQRSSESMCTPVDTDGNGSQELICLQNNGPVSDPGASHRLYVIEYVPGAAPRLQVRWQALVGELPRRVAMGAGSVSDLDGDGSLEIVVSGVLQDNERWATYVFDAAAGSLLAEIADGQVAGVSQLGNGEGATLFTASEEAVQAWTFERSRAARVQSLWSLGEHRVIVEPDWSLARITNQAGRVLTLDITGDGVAELFLASTGPGGGLVAYDVASGAPEAVASFPVSEWVSIVTAWATPALPQEPPRLLVALSDGIMHVLDDELGVLARGLRFGGYYPKGDWRNLYITPVLADLGTGADSIVMSDSRGALLRIDAEAASMAVPPRVPWSVRDATSPIIVPGLDGDAPGIVCRQEAVDGSHSVTVLDASGALLRSADVGGQLLSDIVPAELDGDGVADLIVEWGEPGNLELRHRAYSGARLSPLWDSVPQFKGTTRFPAGGAITDWNGDGVDDFVHQYYGTQVLSGVDGSILAESADNGFYFMPIVMDVTGDAQAELILQAGFNPLAILSKDFTPLWASSDDDRPYPYGAVASTCPDGVPRLIEGSLRYPSRLKITQLGGAGMGTYTSVVLAGGQLFDDEESAGSAGLFLGQLTSTSLHENLTGNGQPIAVVGSEDGWLYAIEGCTGQLAFSVAFGASVGAIAFGDTDGNGKDEIIVAVADGYLYALKEPPVGAPRWIIDIDPPSGVTDTDIDLIAGPSSMSAVWEPVPEADGYEVAVLHAGTHEFMTLPPWQPVGNVTRATVSGLSLARGEEYIFAVRAFKEAEPSPDAISDGVVVDVVPGYPAGCTCDSQGTGRRGTLVLCVLVWVMLAWPRQRARKPA